MASSELSLGSSGIDTGTDSNYRSEIMNLPVDSESGRGDSIEARDDTHTGPTRQTDEKLVLLEVSPPIGFASGFKTLLDQQEEVDGVDFVTKSGGETTNPTVHGKETIFRKELTKLIVGTPSRKDSREIQLVGIQVSSTPKMGQMVDTKEVKSLSEIVTQVENVVNDSEKATKETGCDSLMKTEANNADLSTPSKETIFRKELKNLEVKTKNSGDEVKDSVQCPPVEQIEGKSEFKGVSSTVGSKTELRSVTISQERVKTQIVAETPTNIETETDRQEQTTVLEGKADFKGVSSTVGSVTELKTVAISQDKVKVQEAEGLLRRLEPNNINTERLISVLQTVREGQVEGEDMETKEPKQKSKRLSTGALELKAKAPAILEVGSSFERKRKRSHVPLSVLERMEKDPIVAQHFAQLESPSAETVSDSGDNSRRFLHTTNRLRRTTDSVGLKYVNQYIVIKVLGCGTYGKVKLCLNTMDCKLYAVKIVHRKWLTRRSIGGTTENVGHGAMREIAIMKKLNHPNIVALHEVIDDPSKRKLYLILEYVEGGPIMGNEMWSPFPEDKARFYFRDMCKGIDYLHFNKIVHRDLKPGNLLQTLDGKIKISDFGVSHMFEQESDSMHDTAGTPAFLAPEVCSGGECHGRPADLWSLGVCLYVMVFAKLPFPGDSIIDMYEAIMHKELAFSSKIKVSKGLKDILTLILTKDPSVRIPLAGIMQHDWVTKDGLEPLVPYKVQVARGSTIMSVTEDEVEAAIGVNKAGLGALCTVNPVEKEFEEGEYIIRQGEEGNEMYFINSGQCEVLVESRSLTQPSRGRMEYAVAERGPGQFIGEMELQKGRCRKPPRRNASIRAKTRVVTLVVSKEQVMEVLSKNAEAAQSMADTIAERDRELQMRLRALDLRMPSMRLETEEEAQQPEETCSSCRCF